jgi:hypothetical protein
MAMCRLLAVAGGEVCGKQEDIGKDMAGMGACTVGFRRPLHFRRLRGHPLHVIERAYNLR